jgi:hypothetical protein
MKDRALRYLIEQCNASEYEDARDEVTLTWNTIASIMENYAKGIAMEQRMKDYLHSKSFPDLPIDPCCTLITDKEYV